MMFCYKLTANRIYFFGFVETEKSNKSIGGRFNAFATAKIVQRVGLILPVLVSVHGVLKTLIKIILHLILKLLRIIIMFIIFTLMMC